MLQTMLSLFFPETQVICFFFLIANSCMSWSLRLASIKEYVWFYIFDFISFLSKFLALKCHFSFENLKHKKNKKRKKKNTCSCSQTPLVFKLQQEVLKSSDIYVSCRSPKLNWKTNFLNLENRSFENVSFS